MADQIVARDPCLNLISAPPPAPGELAGLELHVYSMGNQHDHHLECNHLVRHHLFLLPPLFRHEQRALINSPSPSPAHPYSPKMAEILPALLHFPANGSSTKKKLTPKEYDIQITGYVKEVLKIKDVSFTKTTDKKNLLDLLDPAVNSIAYMVTFNRQISAAGKDQTQREKLLPYGVKFLHEFDPVQVRYAGEEWRILWETVQQIFLEHSATDISSLVTGMLRLDPSAGTFTINHLQLVRLALRNGVPSQSLPILSKSIYAFPTKSSKRLPEELPSEDHEFSNSFITQSSHHSLEIRAEHVLEYYLLGASIYTALGNYVRARLFLEHVLLSPSQPKSGGFSALQVEACQKWILLGLLVEGKRFPLPPTMDGNAIQNIRHAVSPYDALAHDFEKRDVKKFQAEFEEAGSLWADDGNLRLVKEVASALLRYRIIDLQKTYAVLPVVRIAELIESDLGSTTALLQNMIETGSLSAELTQSGVLTFRSSDAKLPDVADGPDDLETRTQRIEELIKSLREADRRLQLTKDFVEYVKRTKKAGGGVEGDLADVMDLEYDNPASIPQTLSEHGNADDEDLMV